MLLVCDVCCCGGGGTGRVAALIFIKFYAKPLERWEYLYENAKNVI